MKTMLRLLPTLLLLFLASPAHAESPLGVGPPPGMPAAEWSAYLKTSVKTSYQILREVILKGEARTAAQEAKGPPLTPAQQAARAQWNKPIREKEVRCLAFYFGISMLESGAELAVEQLGTSLAMVITKHSTAISTTLQKAIIDAGCHDKDGEGGINRGTQLGEEISKGARADVFNRHATYVENPAFWVAIAKYAAEASETALAYRGLREYATNPAKAPPEVKAAAATVSLYLGGSLRFFLIPRAMSAEAAAGVLFPLLPAKPLQVEKR